MLGAFGGDIAPHETEAVELVEASLAGLLLGEGGVSAPRGPSLVPILARGSELVYEGDLRGLAPLEPTGELAARLTRLQQALEALEALHAAGRAHGDLRPGHVWTGASTRLSFTAKEVAPGQLLRARLRAGADPTEVDFAAPEILAGASATPASDVYSAAALAHSLILGRPPHGRPSKLRSLDGALGELDVIIARALDPEPEQRPPLAELRRAVTALARDLASRPASPGPRVSLVAAGSPGARPTKDTTGTPIILTCLLATGGFFLLLGAIWLAVVSFAVMNDAGRFGLLFAVSGTVAVAGGLLERRGYLRSGFALITIATQLIWANGAYLVVLLKKDDSPESWFLLAAVVAGLTEGLALLRRSALLSSLAAADTAIACVLLGATLRSGSFEGPSIWCFVTAAVLGAVAFAGQRRAGLATGLPSAIAALVFVLASWIASLALFGRYGFDGNAMARPFATAWPYALAAAAAGASFGLAHAGAKAYATLAAVAAFVLIAFTPMVESLSNWESLGYRYTATILGAGLVVAAFHVPRLARDQGVQLLTVLTGLVSLCLAPTFVAFVTLGSWRSTSGDSLVGELVDPALPLEARLHHPLAALAHVCGISGALVALGLLFARDAERKVPYRALELAGLAAFFVTLTGLSIASSNDFLFPAILFTGGLLALAVGAWQRHIILVIVPAAAVVLNGCIQYFAKLHDAFPLALLLMGFGIFVLVGGVLFERKIKPLWPELKTWA